MKFNRINKAIDRLLIDKGDISGHIDEVEISKYINKFKYKVEKYFAFFVLLLLILLTISLFYSTINLITLSIFYLAGIIIITEYIKQYSIRNKIKKSSLLDSTIIILISPVIILLALFTDFFYQKIQNFYLIEEDIDINGTPHVRKINYIGTESYYLNGKLNREDGLPAYINYENYIYYLNGKEIIKIYREDLNVDLINSKSYQNKMREKIKKAKIANKINDF